MSIKTPVKVGTKIVGDNPTLVVDADNKLFASTLTPKEAAEIAAKLNLWPQMVALLKEYSDAIACPCAKDLLAACEKIEKGET